MCNWVSLDVVPAKAGTHTPRPRGLVLWQTASAPPDDGGYGPRVRGDDAKRAAVHRRHTPRMRGIQYAAASRFNHGCLWNTGSPAFAGDDSQIQISNSNIPGSHSFAISPRDAPEFLLSTFRPHVRGRRECRALGAPAASRAKIKKHTSKSPRSHRNHPAFPAQWF
jgi:hypothetical protein